jgi:hypothetical protein
MKSCKAHRENVFFFGLKFLMSRNCSRKKMEKAKLDRPTSIQTSVWHGTVNNNLQPIRQGAFLPGPKTIHAQKPHTPAKPGLMQLLEQERLIGTSNQAPDRRVQVVQ